jgi:hypothetical protein
MACSKRTPCETPRIVISGWMTTHPETILGAHGLARMSNSLRTSAPDVLHYRPYLTLATSDTSGA